MFFGFSGTPIHTENIRHDNTTTDVFGDELHRYSIADGIRDKNVLGFDPYKVLTYKNSALREAVALEKAKAPTVKAALADPKKKAVFNRYMNDVPMAGHRDNSGTYVSGIEDHLSVAQYEREEHRRAVIQDLAANWVTLSQDGKFHAIFATGSIPEAILYYRLIKTLCPQLKISALFDPLIDDEGAGEPAFKSDGLVEILTDYNTRYGQNFAFESHAGFKKDIAARLAHKKPYTGIATEPAKQLDLLIVVNQMLTGYDSKWVNTLYLDKLLEYENIIQAFSRTNRLFGPDKPFGTIRYYRKPHTMERNIRDAVRLYSGDKAPGLFADRLPRNLERMNAVFADITAVFAAAGIEEFKKLPDSPAERAAFAKHFQEFSNILEAARIQGFAWERSVYASEDAAKEPVQLIITQHQYLTLLQRYKELGTAGPNAGGGGIPFDIDSHISAIDTGKIDADYMNARFAKYLKELKGGDHVAQEKTLAELHHSFTSLSQEDQRFAAIFLHDIQRGDVEIVPGRTFRDYLTDYQARAQNKKIEDIVRILGIDKAKLTALMSTGRTEGNLNEYGRFDDLKATMDKAKAKRYFDAISSEDLSPAKVTIRATALLRKFILQDGFELGQAVAE